MLSDTPASGRELFVAVFSDDPLPNIDAAIVVAHPGDEAVSASWVMARLQQRASVYCLTRASHGCPGGLMRDSTLSADAHAARAATSACAALAGVPDEQCHNLGLAESSLAQDLESLVWLTTAAVTAMKPHVLVTHACEGRNLDHDATCLAVHVAARLMPRHGAAAPLVVELPRHGELDANAHQLAANARQAVRVEFGPESRKVKRRMLQCHAEETATVDAAVLQSESYVLAAAGNPCEGIADSSDVYLDAPWCAVGTFRRHAAEVVAKFNRAVLSMPAQA